MDSKEQTVRLVKMQKLATETSEAQALVESAPTRIAEIEERFRERNAEYVAVKERYDVVDTDQKTRQAELAVLEESRKKWMEDLMQVQNQREYSAILKEIDLVKSRISEHEDAILKDMEEIEKLKVDLASHESHIQEERKIVEQELADLRAAVINAEKRIEYCIGERKALESGLPDDMVLTVHRVEELRQGVFLAEAIDGTCQSCYVRVRPQAYQEIKQASAVHACGSCRRFLYHPSAVDTGAGEETCQEVDPAAIQTVNGS